MRTVKPHIQSGKSFGKDHDVPVVRFCDKRESIHVPEVLCLSQSDPHPVSGIGTVGDDVLTFNLTHTWIFHAELFIGGKRAVKCGNQERLWIGGEVESVMAAG